MRLIAALILSAAVASPAAAVMKQMPGSRPEASPMVMPVMRTVTADRAAEIKAAVGQDLTRNIDPNTLKGQRELARIEAGFNPAAAAEITDQVDKVLFQYFSDDDSAESYRALAASISEFVNAYHNLLSGTQVLKLTQFADEARQAAGSRVMADANGIAKQLGTGRAAVEVPGAESAAPRRLEPARASEVDLSGPLGDINTPMPPILEAQGQEPKKGLNWYSLMTYAGVVLIILGFGVYALFNWMVWGPAGIMVVSASVAGGLYALGRVIGADKFPKTAGLLNAAVVGMVPLFTYGLLAAFGKAPGSYHSYYTHIDLGWVWMELATIAAAAAMAFFDKAKSSMVAFPAAIAAWFLSMDLASAFTGSSMTDWQTTHAWFSVVSGMAMMGLSRLIEKITKIDYPFWGYLAGLLAFSGGLATLPSNGEIGHIMFFAAHVGLMAASLFLQRVTFVVFGAMGALFVIGFHWAPLFAAQWGWSFTVSGAGVVLVASAWLIKRNLPAIKAWLRKKFPAQQPA